MESLSLDDPPTPKNAPPPVLGNAEEGDFFPLEHGTVARPPAVAAKAEKKEEQEAERPSSVADASSSHAPSVTAAAAAPPPPPPVASVPSGGGGGHLVAPARSVFGVSPNQMPAKDKERAAAAGAAATTTGVIDAGASIGRVSATSTSSTPAVLKGSASAFALAMRARAKAVSERASASLKAADLGGVWHGAVDAAGAALAATEEKIRKLSSAAAGSSSSSPSAASLSALCKAEAAARPCPRLVLSACCSIAAEAGRAASERAFVADVPFELAGFVLAELDDAAGVALPPPGTSPAILATALKHFLASLPDPLLPAKCLPEFIGAGIKNAPASAAAAAAAALSPGPAAVLSLLVETMSRVATAGGEAGISIGAPTPAELAESLVPCISWHPGAPKPTVSSSSAKSSDGGTRNSSSPGGGGGGEHSNQPPSPAGGSAHLHHLHNTLARAELTPGEAAAVARAVEILILTAADRAAGGGGLGGGGGGFGFGGAGSLGSAASFGSEPVSPMGFFGGNAAAGGGGGGGGDTEG